MTYKIVPCENPVGWWTVLRNGNPIWHWSTQEDAEAFSYLCARGRTDKQAAVEISTEERDHD